MRGASCPPSCWYQPFSCTVSRRLWISVVLPAENSEDDRLLSLRQWVRSHSSIIRSGSVFAGMPAQLKTELWPRCTGQVAQWATDSSPAESDMQCQYP